MAAKSSCVKAVLQSTVKLADALVVVTCTCVVHKLYSFGYNNLLTIIIEMPMLIYNNMKKINA